jgi:hypothetical protein
MLNAMLTREAIPVNTKKTARVEAALAEILAEATRRGFFGTAGVEISVQDGAIQHIRRKVDRMEK